MSVELRVPEVGESIAEVEIVSWLKKEGDPVSEDENIVEVETDKASVELPAPASGVLTSIVKKEGEIVAVGDVIARIDDSGNGAKAKKEPKKEETKKEEKTSKGIVKDEAKPAPARKDAKAEKPADKPKEEKGEAARVMPSAQRLLAEHGIEAKDVEPSGPGGRLLKEDVLRYLEEQESQLEDAEEAEAKPAEPRKEKQPESATRRIAAENETDEDLEEVVPMSLIRRRIAERLVRAQHEAALLTTVNEVDMSAVMAMRKKYGEAFQKKYNIKLGFMSFFVKAAIEALKEFPAVNAEVQGTNVVYRNYYNIGVAIGGGKGLVVPVLRRAERMSFGEIELTIAEFAKRAQENKIKPEELQDGTFTISNGGVYGSLLSTPIINPPQSGILGMHAIQDRPVALDGQVVIRPMMYIALTYDHRLVDGREAVTFLRRIKETVEDPARILIEV
jgi:2-oxoglutarate dehydrogenase E2 component (dihydrolipoamide succinyltransferase)